MGTPDTFDPSELCAALDKIMQSEDSALFAAESDGHVVELAAVYLSYDEPNQATVTRCYGYQQSLMVDAAFHRESIATRLMATAEGWAREHGAAECGFKPGSLAAIP